MSYLPAILLVVCWLQLFNELRNVWAFNEQYSYGWFVPLLAAALLWRRWQAWPSASIPQSAGSAWRPPSGAVAVGLIALGLLLPFRLLEVGNPGWLVMHWVHALSLLGFSLGLLYIWGGAALLRHFWFPFLFLLTAVAWPTKVDQWVTQGLMQKVASVTIEVVGLFGVPALQHGNVIETTGGTVGIDEACSGIRSLQTSIMLAFLLGDLFNLTSKRRVLLFPFGMLVAMVANVGRTSLLTWSTAKQGLAMMHRWHDPAGLAVVAVVMGSLLVLAWLWRENPAEGSPTPVAAPGRAAAAGPAWLRLLPGGVMVACCLWVPCSEGLTWAWFHWPGKGPSPAPSWAIRWPSNQVDFAMEPLPKRTLEILACTESATGSWSDPDGNHWNCIYLFWPPRGDLDFYVGGHNPEQCMGGVGAVFLKKLAPVAVPVGPSSMFFNHRLFEQEHQVLHVFQGTWEPFVPAAGQRLFNESSLRARFRNVLERRLLRGGTTLEILLRGPASEEEARRLFQREMGRLIGPTR